jgi:hypothetical protein
MKAFRERREAMMKAVVAAEDEDKARAEEDRARQRAEEEAKMKLQEVEEKAPEDYGRNDADEDVDDTSKKCIEAGGAHDSIDDDDEDNDDDDNDSSSSSLDFYDQHKDFCEVCGQPGLLLCCAMCNIVSYMHCAGLQEEPLNDWMCAYCLAEIKPSSKDSLFETSPMTAKTLPPTLPPTTTTTTGTTADRKSPPELEHPIKTIPANPGHCQEIVRDKYHQSCSR